MKNEIMKQTTWEAEMDALLLDIPLGGDINYTQYIENDMRYYATNEHFGNIDMDTYMQNSRLKKLYADEGMFAFVSWKWVPLLAEYLKGKKCLEVMAGRGWLSLALRKFGIDIVTTDDFSWANDKPENEYYKAYTKMKYPVTEMIKKDAIEAVEQYGKDIDILIISWPWKDDTAYRTIKRLHELNKDALIVYIGFDTCEHTADGLFYKHFNYINIPQFDIINTKYQSWQGLQDGVYLGQYVDKL